MLLEGRGRRTVAAAVTGVVAVSATMAALTQVSAADPTGARQAAAKAPRTVQVSGQLIPVDLDQGTYRVKGELIGTWTFPPRETTTVHTSGTRLYQTGIEYFDGCLNLDGDRRCGASEPSGRWRSEYISWASLDRGRLEGGGCTHVLTAGSGAFVGVRGLLQMEDVYASTAAGSTSIYQGEIVLNAVADDEPLAAPSVTGLRTGSAAGSTRAGC